MFVVDRVLDDPTLFRPYIDRMEEERMKAHAFQICGDGFLKRFRSRGDDKDILGATEAYEQAAVCLSKNAPDMQDISEANRQQRVIQLTPEYADLPKRFSALASVFWNRFENAGDMQDISEAIRHQQRAVQLTPDGHADLSGFLNDLGISFVRRFQHTGEIQDISEAILHLQRAVQMTPDGHANFASASH
jgi:tetratricopeptide (TPR) repeat protein